LGPLARTVGPWLAKGVIPKLESVAH